MSRSVTNMTKLHFLCRRYLGAFAIVIEGASHTLRRKANTLHRKRHLAYPRLATLCVYDSFDSSASETLSPEDSKMTENLLLRFLMFFGMLIWYHSNRGILNNLNLGLFQQAILSQSSYIITCDDSSNSVVQLDYSSTVNLRTPNFPNPYPKKYRTCVRNFVGPTGSRVRLMFTIGYYSGVVEFYDGVYSEMNKPNLLGR